MGCPIAHPVVSVLAVIWARHRATRAIARRVAARLAAIHLLRPSAMLRRARRRALEAPRGSAIVADVALEAVLGARLLAPLAALLARRITVVEAIVAAVHQRVVLDGVERALLAVARNTEGTGI